MDGNFEFLSIEEGVQSLIGPDEIVIGSSASRLVMNGARLVGYIQVCDATPCLMLTLSIVELVDAFDFH